MEPHTQPSDEEILAQVALGELPADRLPPGANREILVELTQIVERVEQAYAVEAESRIDPAPPSEFQLARMDRARREAAARGKAAVHRPAWRHFAVAAVVLLLGVLSVFVFQPERGTQDGDLAQNDVPEVPYVGVRGGGEKTPLPAAPGSPAQPLAPLGEIHTLQPLLFIWKADPTAAWDLRLFRKGETTALATAKDARSPYPIERLLPAAEGLQAGGEFHWELVNPTSGESAARGEFQLTANASVIANTDSTALRAAMDSAIREGRPSEALILLFSLHSELATEDFVRLRRELESTLLKKE